MIQLLSRLAVAATLVLPVFLMHGRGVAEGLIGGVDVLFLARCAVRRDWGWVGARWVGVAGAWWGWLVVCSVPGIGIGGTRSLVQALVMGRFLVFVAALEHWVLAERAARRWLQWVLDASALYIAGQTLIQLATGHNLQGYPRRASGELTGPFENPRAGAPLSRLIFPVLLPAMARVGRVAGLVMAVAGVGVVVLIGQRMPLLLTVFGMVVAGLLLRRLRVAVAVALGAGAVLLAASAVVVPPTFYRLVTKFSAQMEDFPASDYGLIGARAVFIALDHPVFGQGFDGFRNACPDPRYFRTIVPGRSDGGGAGICNIHPHNHYLEAATNAGLPGLVLFSAMVVAWLGALGRGLWRDPDPLRVGLFVAALVQEWPIASASGFTAVEIGGWFFLLLGYGLAVGREANA
jgi:O-antigen ligase